jgi:protein-S-isoprenylcysteine O-methyltransferase Ste14
MEISAIRLYLLSGLLIHKLVWEVLKRRGPASAPNKSRTLKTRLLSLVKVAILAAILIQTLAPEFLPLIPGGTGIRIAGVGIYTLGLLTAVIARIQLGRNWSDIEKSYVQRNHVVVAHGLYRWVRHPIYAGDLLLLIGLELALNSAAVFAAVALVLYVRQQAIREERTLLQTLPGYEQYYRRTARFLPFLPV